jgi:hypothetical protein
VGEGKSKVLDLIEQHIGGAQAEVLQSYMTGIQRNIWPDVVIDFHGFRPAEGTIQGIPMLIRPSLLDLKMYQANVEDLFQSPMEVSS